MPVWDRKREKCKITTAAATALRATCSRINVTDNTFYSLVNERFYCSPIYIFLFRAFRWLGGGGGQLHTDQVVQVEISRVQSIILKRFYVLKYASKRKSESM